MKNIYYFLLFVILLLGASFNLPLQAQENDFNENQNMELPDPNLKLEHSLYLIGDAGGSVLGDTSIAIKYLGRVLKNAPENTHVAFLGNNLLNKGMPPREHLAHRPLAEHQLGAQVDIVKNFKGTPIFIPGNKDWKQYGLEGLKRQEKFIEKKLNEGIKDEDDWKNYFFPDDGCSGPAVIDVNEKLAFVIIDSQWWLQDWDEIKEINSGCEYKNRAVFMIELEEALRKNRSKNVVILMHHPLYTYGPHGGGSSLKEHIFPLTHFQEDLYIPLPGIGTVMELGRKKIGTFQDVAHQDYTKMKKALINASRKNGSFIFASAHEHSLQYIEAKKQHFIVSGSGSKSTKVKKGKGCHFASREYGFSKLDFYEDGSVWLEFWKALDNGEKGEMIFRKKIKSELSIYEENIPDEFPEYDQKLKTKKTYVIDKKITRKGSIHKIVLGKHYRQLYTHEYDFPVLDLSTYQGGMTPVKRGGGNQTNSLRLRDSTGREYVMRDMTKDASRFIPYPFNKMDVATNIVEDNFLSTHPFAPLVVPILADAAKVYHTNPKIFYVPKQPALDIHNDLYGGRVYLVEERPDDQWKGLYSFGETDKITSTPKLADRLVKNHEHFVDQKWTVRSRLFDLLIGDWDRHDDQWRWARIQDKDDEKIWRPIPRDRDQPFSKYDGLITKAARLTMPFMKQLKTYKPEIGDIKWSVWSARRFDRTFLNELTWEDYEREAKYIQEHVTDEVIDRAFDALPQKAEDLTADQLKAIMKQRRAHLVETARKFYELNSQKVDVLGTNNKDLFEIVRLPGGKVEVKVYDTNSDGDKQKLFYHRVFDKDVTKEIHVYGMDEEDIFHVSGETDETILVRIIGGLEEDFLIDVSLVEGIGKTTLYYDNKQKNEMDLGQEAKDMTTDKWEFNLYDRNHPHYEFDFLMPLPLIGFNEEEGFSLGTNLLFTDYGFKKMPYKASHRLFLKYAFGSQSLNLQYNADWLEVFKEIDLLLDARIFSNNFTYNFYGFGNETKQLKTEEYYKTNNNMLYFSTLLRKRFLGGSSNLSFGPSLQRVTFLDTPNTFISDFGENNPEIFKTKNYAGALLKFDFEYCNHRLIPSRGTKWNTQIDAQADLGNAGQSFGRILQQLTFYRNLDNQQKIIFATRLGVQHNIGDAPYFYSAALGGLNNFYNEGNLRGYPAERFYGKTSFYHNTDLRIKLAESINRIIPMTFGLLGGIDYGRVWQPGENSQKWHVGYGGGIWVAPLNAVLINFQYFLSEEDKRFSVRMGFDF